MIAPGATAGLASFALCLTLTPIVRKLCLRWGAVDSPGPLKIHTRPTPRLGGIAVALSIFAAILVSAPHAARENPLFFAAFTTIWLIGLADDLRSLPALARLAGQVVPAILLWLGGWRFSIARVLPGSGAASLVSVCAIVIVFANSFNFLDGSDGIAAGVAGLTAVAYLAISHSALSAARDPFASAVAWSIFASSAAFLFFNFSPASIFLGDSGSTVLGFCIAFLTLDPARANQSATSLAFLPFVLAGLPVIDAALAVLRRLRQLSSPLQGDRSHFYDLLLARGWSPLQVALACYGITIGLALVAWLGMHFDFRSFEILSAVSLAGLFLVAVRLGSLQSRDRNGGKRRRQFEVAPNASSGSESSL